jgi:hypothetical protein
VDNITVINRRFMGAPSLVVLTYATPRTGSLGIRDYIEPRCEFVGMTLLPSAIREAMKSEGVTMLLPAPAGMQEVQA